MAEHECIFDGMMCRIEKRGNFKGIVGRDCEWCKAINQVHTDRLNEN